MNIKHISALSLIALTSLTTIASFTLTGLPLMNSEIDTTIQVATPPATDQSENIIRPLSVRNLIREQENNAAIEADYSREQFEYFHHQHHFRVQQATFFGIGECMDKDIQANNVHAMNYCYSALKPTLKKLAKHARINELDSHGNSANYRLFRKINKENKEEEAKAFNAVEQKLETIRTLIAQQQKAQ